MLNEFEGKDVFDSRDVEKRIVELETIKQDVENAIEDSKGGAEVDPEEMKMPEDEETELAELLKFRDDVGSDEWDCGIGFIEDSYFEEYARDFAEDIGSISSDTKWPATCIDWERAARELQMDYSSVEFGDSTYYYN